MRAGQLKLLSLEQLQRLHVNCLNELMSHNQARHIAAEAMLTRVHAEFGDRHREPDGFVPMLRTMGYHVRNNGLTEVHRRFILRRIVHAELPPLNGREYMNDWAEPGSIQRCRTLRRDIRRYLTHYGAKPWMVNAVARWRDDLLFVETMGLELAERLALTK